MFSNPTRHLSPFRLLWQGCFLQDSYKIHKKWFVPFFLPRCDPGHGTKNIFIRRPSSFSPWGANLGSTKPNASFTSSLLKSWIVKVVTVTKSNVTAHVLIKSQIKSISPKIKNQLNIILQGITYHFTYDWQVRLVRPIFDVYEWKCIV